MRPGACISNTTPQSVTSHLEVPAQVRSTKLYRRLNAKMQRRSFKKRMLRVSIVTANIVVMLAVVLFVAHNAQADSPTPKAASLASSAEVKVSNPLDQLSSADIALTVARLNGLPEATAITNQADSQITELSMAPTSDAVVAKPQVVSTALKSQADIKAYTTVSGDTISAIATKFGVTSDSIRWSNNLTGDSVNVGVKLSIPPVNGIIYTVKAGDTADSLATKFKSNKDKIIAFNDAEIKGLQVGQQILIPDGTQAVAASASQVARAAVATTSFPWGGASPVYGYNGYDYGYCTWYVASVISVPSNWGNANTWDNLAPMSGWTVSTVPRAGAIAQTDAGYFGHVAVVQAVSDDGTMIKYADMNGLAGWGRVGYSDWTSAGRFQHYIYR